MFKTAVPKIFAHASVVDQGNYVLPDYILNKNEDPTQVNLFRRHCPHRMYPLHETGELVQDIWCKFHNFRWDSNGVPINNPKKLTCGSATVGRSGLIFKDFVEPDHRWVDDLAKEKNLRYSHCYQGTSQGSWLWLTDIESDLLHVYNEGIHPFLAQQISLDDMVLEQGDGWILQIHPNGWWLYIFPFIFVEYGDPGMVMVNNVVPHNIESEYGFDWITQFYYDSNVTVDRRYVFETLEKIFREDVAAVEKQKGNYFPLMKAMNRYEDHCVHFGEWFLKNKR